MSDDVLFTFFAVLGAAVTFALLFCGVIFVTMCIVG